MGFRYIGSKNKIIPELVSKIQEIVGPRAHIADLMCGTGSVSVALRKSGYTVTAVDLMSQSYHHAKVQLLLNEAPKFQKIHNILNDYKLPQQKLIINNNYEKLIDYLNNIPPIKGYFWKEFSPEGSPINAPKSRKYFSPENAAKIDGVRNFIQNLKENNYLEDLEYSLLVHDIIMAVNDVANIAGTYGHYLSSFNHRALESIKFKPTNFVKEGKVEGHTIMQGYAEELSKLISCDLCYIDPPYMKRQYASNYHILETIARGDEPEALGQSGLRPWRDQYSNFCSKTKIRSSFKKIFLNINCKKFLISYSEDGLLSKDELTDFFSKFGELNNYTIKNKRFRSNNSSLSPSLSEYLFYLTMP